ncbi:MAG: hypothetical protein JST00_10445 [Deltaproteobacteria bacterium]|nr:hypothetical protein [Deltaproteobacteria bacterium]
MTSTLAIGCHRLPETVKYEASVAVHIEGEPRGSRGDYHVDEIAGLDLMLDGKPVGKLVKESVSAKALWSGPKASYRAQLDGKYSVTLAGLCGPTEVALEGPPPMWKNMSERELAKSITSRDGRLMIYLDAKIPEKKEVYVDWESARGTLTIGGTVIPPGTKKTVLAAGGCKSPPQVVFDGTPIGEIDLFAKAALITLQPNVCHVLQQVAYGSAKATRPPTFFPAKAVQSVSDIPDYALEFGPQSFKLSSKGTTITELVRARCR